MLEHAITYKTGKPPKPLEEYDVYTAQALLFGWDDVQKAIEKTIDESDDWMWVEEFVPVGDTWRKIKKPVRVTNDDTPMETGDPVADEWERQLARGETPDW